MFSGFILAGGKSRRMKKNKAFLDLHGKTFLEKAVESLRPFCQNSITIVLNDSSQILAVKNVLPKINCVCDIEKNRGAIGGIHAALKNSDSKHTIILACDLPLVTSETIENLQQRASDLQFEAIVPRQPNGKLQPLCAIYQTAPSLRVLEKLLAEKNSLSVMNFIENLSTLVIEPECLESAIVENPLFNVNTPEEYEKLFFRYL